LSRSATGRCGSSVYPRPSRTRERRCSLRSARSRGRGPREGAGLQGIHQVRAGALEGGDGETARGVGFLRIPGDLPPRTPSGKAREARGPPAGVRQDLAKTRSIRFQASKGGLFKRCTSSALGARVKARATLEQAEELRRVAGGGGRAVRRIKVSGRAAPGCARLAQQGLQERPRRAPSRSRSSFPTRPPPGGAAG
jgi:hypothetical protein